MRIRDRPGKSGVCLTGTASLEWTATASVGLTGIARVAVVMAATGLVAVGGDRTVSMTWTMPLLVAMSAPVTFVSFTVIASMSDTANLTVAPLRVSTRPEKISELGSAAPRTCSAISTAPTHHGRGHKC